MSYRFDTPLISGAYHFGNRGLGVLGSQVPSTGTNGPGYIYNDLSLPADANKEYSGFVETPPGVGTFFAFEDSSFTYSGPTTSFVYRLREDGVDKGTQTVNISTDDTPAATMYWSEANDVFSIAANTPYLVSAAWTEANDVHSIVCNIAGIIGATCSWTEVDDIYSLSGSLKDSGTMGWTESNDTYIVTVNVTTTTDAGTISWTEADDTYSLTGNLKDSGTVVWAEVDDIYSLTGSVSSSNISATVAWTETNDIHTINVGTPVSTTMSWTEANDTTFVTVFVPGAAQTLPANIQVKFKSNRYKITFRRG